MSLKDSKVCFCCGIIVGTPDYDQICKGCNQWFCVKCFIREDIIRAVRGLKEIAFEEDGEQIKCICCVEGEELFAYFPYSCCISRISILKDTTKPGICEADLIK